MDVIVTKGSDGYQACLGDRTWRCAVGSGGIARKLREGDGISPVGCWPVRKVLYREDRLAVPPTDAFPCAPIARDDGWCDAPDHPDYNRPVKLPFLASHEEMWREDPLYDIVVILGQNDCPVVAGAGSAIFLHVARPDYSPTAGCAALAKNDLLELLSMAGSDMRLCFQAEGA